METILVYPKKKEEIQSLKAFLKALRIKYESNPYSPEFIREMKQGDNEIKNGNTSPISLDEIWKE